MTEAVRLCPGQKIQIGSATVELRRQKTLSLPDVSLAPTVAITREILPEELLRDRRYDIGGVVAQGGMGGDSSRPLAPARQRPRHRALPRRTKSPPHFMSRTAIKRLEK